MTSERGQARRLRDAYNLLLACHRRWNLGRVYWFSHRDQPVPSGSGDYWGNHNGLIAADGRWKPGMRAFLRYLRVRARACESASAAADSLRGSAAEAPRSLDLHVRALRQRGCGRRHPRRRLVPAKNSA